jgi:nucleolar protein 15
MRSKRNKRRDVPHCFLLVNTAILTMSKTLQRNLEAKLAALKGPEWDSSDEEAPESAAKIAKKKAPINTKKSKLLNRQAAPEAVKESDASRVIYLGHIPKGFEEAELSAFLGQFGKVTQLKLSRSKKTANTRGYAFIEFVSQQVAAVVAETMSGYLIDSKRMVCHVLPKDKVRDDMFSGKPFKKIDWAARHKAKVNAPKSSSKMKIITKRLLGRERQKRNKLLEMGIAYDFPGYEESNKAFPSKSDPPKEVTEKVQNKMEIDGLPKSDGEQKSQKKKRKAEEEVVKDKTPAKVAKKDQIPAKAAADEAKNTAAAKNPVAKSAKKVDKKTETPVVKEPETPVVKKAATPVAKSAKKVDKKTETTVVQTPEAEVKSKPVSKSAKKANKKEKASAPKTPVVENKKSPGSKSPVAQDIPVAKSVEKTPAAKSNKKQQTPAAKTPPADKTPVKSVEKAPVAHLEKKSPVPKTPAAAKKVSIAVATPAAVEDPPVKKVTPAQTRSRGKTPVKEPPAAKATPAAKKTPAPKTPKAAKDFTPPTTRSKITRAPKTEAKPAGKKASRRGSN